MRDATTDAGIDPTAITPPPTRQVPVYADASDREYVLETPPRDPAKEAELAGCADRGARDLFGAQRAALDEGRHQSFFAQAREAVAARQRSVGASVPPCRPVAVPLGASELASGATPPAPGDMTTLDALGRLAALGDSAGPIEAQVSGGVEPAFPAETIGGFVQDPTWRENPSQQAFFRRMREEATERGRRNEAIKTGPSRSGLERLASNVDESTAVRPAARTIDVREGKGLFDSIKRTAAERRAASQALAGSLPPPSPSSSAFTMPAGAIAGSGGFGDLGPGMMAIAGPPDAAAAQASLQKIVDEKATAMDAGSPVHRKIRSVLELLDQSRS